MNRLVKIDSAWNARGLNKIGVRTAYVKRVAMMIHLIKAPSQTILGYSKKPILFQVFQYFMYVTTKIVFVVPKINYLTTVLSKTVSFGVF